jgi:hypothetical protein
MRLIAVLLFTAAAFAQATRRPCTADDRSRTLQTVLRERGVDALIEEVTRPQRELWTRMKAALAADDGVEYFRMGVNGALLPEMSGTLISQSPAELVLGISDPGTPEVTLRLDAPFGRQLEPGARVLFTGVAVAFLPYPFNLTVDVKRAGVSFLPGKSP